MEIETIRWKANRGQQRKYLKCGAREVLYGGAAGGGKSDAMLMDAAQWASEHPWVRSIIFRRTFPELKEIVLRSKDLFRGVASFNQSGNVWTFRTGSRLEFGYLRNMDDALRYQSRQFTFIGFEELTQWPNDESYVYLQSRLRSPTMPSGGVFRLKIRATTNPGGPGHTWVKKRWRIDNQGTETDFRAPDTGFRRKFIPAKISDNPYLAGTDYIQTLQGLPPNIKAALLDGRWDVVAGTMFGEIWNPNWHIVHPFTIPPEWKRWRGMDDGFTSPHPVVWLTQNPDSKQIVVYQEFVDKRWTPGALGRKIMEMDAYNNEWSQKLSGILDSASFSDPGNSEKARGIQINMQGCRFQPCSKSGKFSRIARVRQLAQLLAKIPDSETEMNPKGIPGIVFFNTCKYLTETIPALPVDMKTPEDIDTSAEDHGYDALMYGLQAISSQSSVITKLGGI